MSRKGVIPFLLICFQLQVKGQVYFDSLYNSELFQSSNEGIWGGVLNNDDGYVFLTFSRDQGLYTSNTWLVQTDFYGQQLSSSLYGNQEQIFMPAALIPDLDGYLGLSTYSEIDTDLGRNQFSLNRFNLGLDTDWVRYYGDSARNDNAFDLIRCVDDGLLLVGQSTDNSGSTSDMYAVRTDLIGNLLWEKFYGGSNWDAALSAIPTPDLGYFIIGTTRSFGAGQRDFYLVKTDSLGNQQWQRTYGGSDMETGTCIIALTDGNYLLAGAQIIGGIDKGKLIKIDPDGNVIWQNEYIYPGCSASEINKVIELSDGSIIGAGVSDKSNEGNSGWLLKTDSEGNEIWQRKYNKNNNTDLFYSVLLANDGGFLLSGQARNAETNSQDAWLLKVDSVGCPYPNCTVGVDEVEKSKVVVDVWPNPASEVVRLHPSTPLRVTDLRVTVTDMQGRQFPLEKGVPRNEAGDSFYEIDVSLWPNGLYIFTITNGQERARVRVVVQH